MGTIFLGSEALARGELTRGRLRSAYRPMFPDVYQSRLATPSLYGNTMGAWLWSKRRAVVTGRAAAALHGAKWVDENAPIELIWQNHRPPSGIIAPLVDEFRGAHGVRRCREALDLMDAGGQSPKESWLRLLLIDAGFSPTRDADIGARRHRTSFCLPRHGLGRHDDRG